jgi:ParB-like chromosome segregation protein Spo0J
VNIVKIPIASIVNDPEIHLRYRLDEETVLRYMDAFDQLPAIVVFETGGPRLLGDGAHRIEAARRLGRKTIEAELREGTRDDASIFAITANQKHGLPLTRDERDEGIRRLMVRGWGWRRISKEMALPEQTVKRVAEGQRVKAALAGGPAAGPLSTSHYEELGRMPEEIRQPLAELTATEGWGHHKMREVAKEAIYKDEDGVTRVNLGLLQKQASEYAHNSPTAALHGAFKALIWLRMKWTPEAAAELSAEERRETEGEIEEYILLLRKVQRDLLGTAVLVGSVVSE